MQVVSNPAILDLPWRGKRVGDGGWARAMVLEVASGREGKSLTRSTVWIKILSSQPPGLYRKVCYLSVAFSLGDPR